MALRLSSTSETIKVVLRIDDALGENANYAEYLKTNNESFLDLKGEPTRIVMRKILPYDLARKVEDAQLSIGGIGGADADGTVDTNGLNIKLNSSYVMEEVRCAICGVENPSTLAEELQIKFSPESDGGAKKEFVAQLHGAGVLRDLSHARKNVIGGLDSKKKK